MIRQEEDGQQTVLTVVDNTGSGAAALPESGIGSVVPWTESRAPGEFGEGALRHSDALGNDGLVTTRPS